MACKIMIGQDIHDDAKPNMTLLSQKIRHKNKEKPSGRKPPRKIDFGKTATKRGMVIIIVHALNILSQITVRVKITKSKIKIHLKSKNMMSSNLKSKKIFSQVS